MGTGAQATDRWPSWLMGASGALLSLAGTEAETPALTTS